MLLLATTGHPDIAERFAHPNLGRLLQPRHTSSAEATARAGLAWAADNDCFQGLHEQRFLKMLDRISDLPGCLFVSCPDVVGDHAATLELWPEWSAMIAAAGQPAAFVLQDGAVWEELPSEVPLFIGGTTEFKLGDECAALVRRAKSERRWVHMGRVNSAKRMAYAASIGVDSIDGTGWVRFKDAHLQRGIDLAENLSAATPLALF
jgi:hypothetical protein